MFNAQSFFDLTRFAHAAVFADTTYCWQALPKLKDYLAGVTADSPLRGCAHLGVPLPETLVLHHGKLFSGSGCDIEYGDALKGKLLVRLEGSELEGASVIMAGAVLMGSAISVGNGVLVESGALIKGPTVIGDRSEVRQGAYLRGNCLVGERCVVGHTTEVKNSIFLDDAKAGHFAYLGDTILGNEVNLGAGTKMANLRFLPGNVMVRGPEGAVDSGLRKLGAVLGDRTQTGCNSVTSPGTIVGRDSLIMPNTTARSGYHSSKSVLR